MDLRIQKGWDEYVALQQGRVHFLLRDSKGATHRMVIQRLAMHIGDNDFDIEFRSVQGPDIRMIRKYSDMPLERETEKKERHLHEWKEYVGLTDRFDYCVTCDEKRR